MSSQRREKIIHILFDIGIIGKGIDGVIEIFGGALLFFVIPDQVHRIIRIVTRHELSEDPHDIIAGYLLRSSEHLSVSAKTFAAVYLLWHGVVKVGLITALLLKLRWAYPLAIIAFFIFLLYQIYRYLLTYSPELLVLSVIDVFVIILTGLEYQRLRTLNTFS